LVKEGIGSKLLQLREQLANSWRLSGHRRRFLGLGPFWRLARRGINELWIYLKQLTLDLQVRRDKLVELKIAI
jgi:hypothetical protein